MRRCNVALYNMIFFFLLLLFAGVTEGCNDNYGIDDGSEKKPLPGSIILQVSENSENIIKFSRAENENSVPTSMENDIETVDVLIFPVDGGRESSCVFHERYTNPEIDNNVFNVTLAAKGDFIANAQYYVYILANCATDILSELDNFLPENGNPKQLKDLQALVQITSNIHLSGKGDENPSTLLMDGTAVTTLPDNDINNGTPQTIVEKIVLNNGNLEESLNLYCILRRAAAKFSAIFSLNNKIIFPDVNWSPDNNQELYKPSYNYNISNMRTDTYVSDPLDGTLPAKAILEYSGERTLENDGISRKSINFTTYTYSHNWSASSSTYENGSYLIVKIPIIYAEGENGLDENFDPSACTWTQDASNNDVWETTYKGEKVLYYSSNYYKLPIGKDSKINRNTHYVIRGTITSPGSVSSDEPQSIDDVAFEVINWEEVPINVGGDSDIHYLYVNKTAFTLRNQAIDNTLVFSSSHPVTVTVQEAYYTDKNKTVKYLYSNGTQQEVTTAAGNKIRVNITAIPSSDLQGNIELNSPVPDNNLIRIIKLKVSNGIPEDDKFVTITQYPLDYIQFREGYYSYWDDSKNSNYEYYNRNYSYDGYRYVAASFNTGNREWESSTGGNFRSKFRHGLQNQVSPLATYSINNNGYITKSIMASNFQDFRMYHIQITSTSDDYVLAIPKLTPEGYTDPSTENSKIVSPSFMLNSQLGAVDVQISNLTLSEVNKFAEKYAEVYQDENGDTYVYDDWRLPTAAEIGIIIKYQGWIDREGYQDNPSEAMFVVMNGSKYWSANGQVDNPNYPNGYKYNVRLVRDVYDEQTLKGKKVSEIFGKNDSYRETKR